MMGGNSGPEHWHEMLAQLIAEQGGDASVTFLLCRTNGRSSEKDSETARRNLANWVDGKALPQRRNFITLSRVLKVTDRPELAARWNALYAKARSRSGEQPEPASAAVEREPATLGKPAPGSSHRSRWLAAAAAVLAGACIAGYWAMRPEAEPIRSIGYLPYAELKVGEGVLVHAKRGECGLQPPEWVEIEHEIPSLRTGRLVDDGLGMSQSVTCGGLTPGRLVRFVAEAPGEEEFELFQRTIKVVVHAR